jgi:uncharacterized protein
MILVDTNVLVYAHRSESPFHTKAKQIVSNLAESTAPWGLSWNAVHEFLAIVTHPKIMAPPTPMEEALRQVSYWLASPTLKLLGEGSPSYWDTLTALLRGGDVRGPKVHDARVASIAIHNGCSEVYSADRDFNRFPKMKVRNPLV